MGAQIQSNTARLSDLETAGTGAQYLVRALEREGVEVVFGDPGGAILPFYDAIFDSPLKHFLFRHEQGAALAADGYARATGKVGVCVATSGPGATNLVTGLANAFLDSIPVIAITGQVPTPVLGTDAFQEVDTVGITMPIVKHSYLVQRVEDLPRIVHEAFTIAQSGRPGPVLIDIPKDVGNAVCDFPPYVATTASPPEVPAPEGVPAALALLRESFRPVAYVGGGVGMADAVDELRAFLAMTGMPVVTTLKGLGAVSGRDPQFLGMIGMHGLKAANLAVQQCDLLVCIGARFDDRVTGRLEAFAPKAKVIHFDIDPAEIGKVRFAEAPVLGDLKKALPMVTVPLDIAPWRERCQLQKEETAWPYDAPGDGVYAPALLRKLSEAAPADTIIAADVGQHQMWIAQHCLFERPENHLSSGGLGTMGYGLPAAIGAQLGHPERLVINVAGDGSVMMNIQELATIARFNLPVKVLIIDNESLGMVRQWQELFLEERYSETELHDNPDFVTLGKAFGIPGFRVTQRDEVDDAVRKIVDTPGPLIVHVLIDPKANVWPFVPPGAAIDNMMEEGSP